jgi:hypothetical protein
MNCCLLCPPLVVGLGTFHASSIVYICGRKLRATGEEAGVTSLQTRHMLQRIFDFSRNFINATILTRSLKVSLSSSFVGLAQQGLLAVADKVGITIAEGVEFDTIAQGKPIVIVISVLL